MLPTLVRQPRVALGLMPMDAVGRVAYEVARFNSAPVSSVVEVALPIGSEALNGYAKRDRHWASGVSTRAIPKTRKAHEESSPGQSLVQPSAGVACPYARYSHPT